jgi:hypothetical protein
VPDIPQAAVTAAAAAIEQELMSGRHYAMAEDSVEALARVALEAAVPVLAEAIKIPAGERMSIGALREALTTFTDLGGAWGSNLRESKEVLLRVHGHVFSLKRVAASFHEGRFVVMLDGETSA